MTTEAGQSLNYTVELSGAYELGNGRDTIEYAGSSKREADAAVESVAPLTPWTQGRTEKTAAMTPLEQYLSHTLAASISCTGNCTSLQKSTLASAVTAATNYATESDNYLAGAPLVLAFTITNASARAVQVLRWNTPLEGAWFAPFVEVMRGGRALPFHAPMIKRGDPDAGAYLRLDPGVSETSEIDLVPPFRLTTPGRYRVTPRIRVLDAFDDAPGPPPRPRSAHAGFDLPCAAVEVTLVTPAKR